MSLLSSIVSKGAPAAGALYGMTASPDADAMLLGVGAKNANKVALEMAKRMRRMGASEDEIWESTGWWRGEKKKGSPEDSAWRWEIDDSKGSLKSSKLIGLRQGGEPDYLEELLGHDELFENYPHLRKMLTGRYKGGDPSVVGEFFPGKNKMNVNVDRSPDDIFSTIIHELQHGVQDAENFPMGGNERMFGRGQQKAFQKRIDDLNDQWYTTDPPYRQAHEAFMKNPSNIELGNKVNRWSDKRKDILEKLKKTREMIEAVEPEQQYRGLYGETEARNVQRRWLAAENQGFDALERSHPGRSKDSHMYVEPKDSPDFKKGLFRNNKSNIDEIAAPASRADRILKSGRKAVFGTAANLLDKAQNYESGVQMLDIGKDAIVPGDETEELLRKLARDEGTETMDWLKAIIGM
ncbi:MAG: hypothetical protein DRQ89_12340 [Epsilonproteobacteria bacterium]|nr:MAG: hypothetical protein DRQ89_12340 [Campylobacterota bacterium]